MILVTEMNTINCMHSHKRPDVSIIVVSYNTRDMTLECLRSIFRETRLIDFEVIVIDNASTDGSADAIAAEFGQSILLIASTENLGFAAGNNKAATTATGEMLLLLNPDTVVLNGAIDHLYAFATQHPQAGIWGGRTLFGNGSLNPWSCWSRMTLWSLFSQAIGFSSLFRHSSLFNPDGIGGWNRVGIRAVDIVSGCFLLLKRDLWEKLGGFREQFFMYGEEADLCLRAGDVGARPMVTSAATIIHYGGASGKIRADKLVLILKAKMLLICFHFPSLTGRIGCWLLSLWPASRYLANLLFAKLGNNSSQAMANIWKEVMQRKNEWQVSGNLNK